MLLPRYYDGMNVLVITAEADALTAGTAARRTLEDTAALTNHTFVIVLNRAQKRAEMQKVSDKLWIFPTNALFGWTAPFKARRIARRELWFQGKLQVSIICALDPCVAGFAGWLIQRFSNKPLQVHVLKNIFSPYVLSGPWKGTLVDLARFVLPRAQGIRVGSESIREAVVAETGAAVDSIIRTLPSFFETEALLSEDVHVDLHVKYPQFKIIILMTGPLIAAQNIPLALHVLESLKKLFPRIGLIIVGDGPEKNSILLRAKELGLGDEVIIEQSNEHVSSYYKTANVFLVTAGYDEYGETVAQAAACGAVIVTTKIGVVSTIIVEGESGFICDPDKPETFVKAIISILHDPGIRENLRVNSRMYLSKSVGWNKEEYLQTYKKLWDEIVEKEEDQLALLRAGRTI